MSENDTVVADDHDIERFKTAFYRFLEVCPASARDAAALTLTDGPVRARLSSGADADAFRSFLAEYRLHRQPAPRFGAADNLGR